MSHYVVHGAKGAQGAPLLASLRASGHDAVGAVRNTSAHENFPQVKIDNASIASLIEAYIGAKGVFLHLPVAPEEIRLTYARNIVKAVTQTKPRRVVISTSGWVVDEPDSPLQNPADSAISLLIRGVQESGVSSAVVAPRLFFENLLNPLVLETIRSEGILRYPIRADYKVSWSTHLDVAEVAKALLLSTETSGVVGVGQLPAIDGDDLARGFEQYFKRPVSFSSIAPQDFGEMIAPLFGKEAAAGVVAAYQTQATARANAIASATSAQTVLGMKPRSLYEWLVNVSA